MAAEDICKDYTSSLEDLTFNSKPLINVLTMLAEENCQHAAEIVKLIEKRIYEVSIEQKLPSLYLMDSIVKNIGKDYITAVTPCIVALFTHVFEQADEKVRMSMFKLRNTWQAYFPAKTLHELDCSVRKRDPGWPVLEPPPPSPSIHINPKFLSKVEESVEESQSSSSSSDEAKIIKEFERKKKELEQLPADEMESQMLQLEELQMKYELIKKKQEKDRQNILKQQQEKILKMRLQQENVDCAEENSSDSKLSEVSTTLKQDSRNHSAKKVEQVSESKSDTDTSTDNTNVRPEETELKPSAASTSSSANKPADKVGFDLEFVPLDKDDQNMDITPTVTYNRDRPLGKNRYFRKDPKAKIMKSDSDSGSDFADTKGRTSDGHENMRSKKGKRSRGGGQADKQRNQLSEENNRDTSVREADEERRRSERDGGRAARRRHSGDKPRNRSNDKQDVPDGVRFAEHRRVRPGEQPEERPGEHHMFRSRVRPGERPVGRPDHPGAGDVVKDKHRRPRRRSEENEHKEDEIMRARFERRDEWSRGRGPRRPHRGRGEGAEGRGRRDFAAERRDHAGVPPFDGGFGEEPPFKKSRPSPPRPLFSEREIFEIRGRRRDSPDHAGLEEWRNERPAFHESWRRDAENMRQPPPEFFNRQFPEGPRVGPRPPRFPPPNDIPPFAPHNVPREFLHHPQRFPGDVEIPMELTLDNESEILRSAEHRLRMGELSVEQHHELLEKLEQLYELQKWQRRRSLDVPPPHDRFIPAPALHPHADATGLPPHAQSVGTEPHIMNEGSRVNVPERELPREPVPDKFARQPPLTNPAEMMNRGEGRPHSPINHMLASNAGPAVLPNEIRQLVDEAAVPPSNLIMEKQTVDDLFKRLMDFGIITKVNQAESPARASTPPVVEAQILREIPVPQLPESPEIKLTLDHLRRRYDGIIMKLHHGTQCSSCGLRFNEADNENYRQHLDWHFRMNRKEKETVTAHRSWFITTDDWLEFESSEDPAELKARSAVFEAESKCESENGEDLQEGSCPVLIDDTEPERACDICFEKFETFWDETSEDWHYKNAVRVDGKTYHYLCYQDAKEADDSDGDVHTNSANEDNDVSNDTAEMENSEDNGVTIGSSNTDYKPSIVTEDTTLEPGVDSVKQGGDDVAIDNSNKEEIKTESS